nr:hypothetical protein [Streptomyces sp. IMTB 1903]
MPRRSMDERDFTLNTHVSRKMRDLAVMALVRNRLKRLQHRPDTLDGFLGRVSEVL